ncbi:amidohydrolase family protein [Neptuniibacter sp. PT8_73]|uniref:amidohydrolase family protein n=1 Tax=Neptuniibacter sp. PT8_73 TaxID=3398206 RepID=UPI0039F49420
MSRVIDPHVHLFNLEDGDYHWLQEGHTPEWSDKNKIRRSYNESDLSRSGSADIVGFVHIEAGFDNSSPWRELEWLECHCELPFRSIAYLDLTSDSFGEHLEQLKGFTSLVGVRYILDNAAQEVLSDPNVLKRLEMLSDNQLIFEAQLSLPDQGASCALAEVMQQLPNLKVVLNHCGSPLQLNEQWMHSITRLAHHPECYIKCSGWEMFNRDWSAEQAKPIISFAIRQFGLTRVMLASNFPVSELTCTYAEVWQRYLKEMKWKGFEKDMLIFENAKRIYQLDID